MTTLTLSHASAAASWLKPIVRFFSVMFAGMREGREIARRYEALSRMSDTELAARGLVRAEIPQVAVNGGVAR